MVPRPRSVPTKCPSTTHSRGTKLRQKTSCGVCYLSYLIWFDTHNGSLMGDTPRLRPQPSAMPAAITACHLGFAVPSCFTYLHSSGHSLQGLQCYGQHLLLLQYHTTRAVSLAGGCNTHSANINVLNALLDPSVVANYRSSWQHWLHHECCTVLEYSK